MYKIAVGKHKSNISFIDDRISTQIIDVSI